MSSEPSPAQQCLDGPEAAPASFRRADLRALDSVISLVYERTRIRLNRSKEALIRARFGKRMRSLGLETLADYWAYVCSPQGRGEVPRAIDALTTNYTHFLREAEHFRFLTGAALPGLLSAGRRRFALWSAACATGEEPYTMAFQLDQRFPLAEGWDWRILATDISTRVLQQAASAIYADDRLRDLPPDWLRQYFQRGVGASAGLCRVKPRLRERVLFQQMNLLDQDGPDRKFEVIFCRNVMIYFDRPTQERLAAQLSRALVPGGYLFTGRAETLNGLGIPLRCLAPSIYQKPEA